MSTWMNTNIDLPAVGFLLIMLLGFWVMYRTQAASNGFDFADMLRNDDGKPSVTRIAALVSLAVMSWGFMYAMIASKGQMPDWQFLGYGAIWSGSKIVEKGLEVWKARNVPSGQ